MNVKHLFKKLKSVSQLNKVKPDDFLFLINETHLILIFFQELCTYQILRKNPLLWDKSPCTRTFKIIDGRLPLALMMSQLNHLLNIKWPTRAQQFLLKVK